MYSNLGKNFCKALPAYHAFTGSDFMASFIQKEKIQPLKKLEKDEELDDDQNNDFIEIEKITSKIVDDVRTEIFMEKYKPKRDGEKLLVSKNLMPV